jgi:hypothetical protein
MNRGVSLVRETLKHRTRTMPPLCGEWDACAADQRFAGTTCTRMGIAFSGSF